jgi:hypothetical protein
MKHDNFKRGDDEFWEVDRECKDWPMLCDQLRNDFYERDWEVFFHTLDLCLSSIYGSFVDLEERQRGHVSNGKITDTDERAMNIRINLYEFCEQNNIKLSTIRTNKGYQLGRKMCNYIGLNVGMDVVVRTREEQEYYEEELEKARKEISEISRKKPTIK